MTGSLGPADPTDHEGPIVPADVLAAAATTIEDREGERWPSPPPDASPMVRRCHELRRMPLRQLSVEDLRVLISQNVGLATTLPMALGMLRDRPLLEGDLYPGDLLVAVLRRPTDDWRGNRTLADLLREALARLDPQDPDYPTGSDLPDLVARATAALA